MRLKTRFHGPWASPGELHSARTGDWRHQRPVTRARKCAHCGTCYLFCPTGCVQDAGTHFSADLEYCKGCGICASMCPATAIVMVREEGD